MPYQQVVGNVSGNSIVYAYDQTWNGGPNESNIIIFTLQTSNGGNPDFNGINYSLYASSLSFVENRVTEGREFTEQGRMLYLKPRPGSGYTTRISFEVLEGIDGLLVVRGPGVEL